MSNHLEDLAGRLSSSSGFEPAQGRPDFIERPADSPSYVVPDLSLLDGDLAGSSPIVVVSAPGAVGKTSLGKYLAARVGCDFWDLSRVLLGDNTFVGSLAKAYGAPQLGRVIDKLSKGEISFVLDAFDEAELRSGWTRIEAFLRELWSYTSGARRVATVLLARSDTAEYLKLFVDGLAGVHASTPLLQIDFFDRSTSVRFLSAQLSRIRREREPERTPAHERYPEPFEQAVDAAFEQVKRTLAPAESDDWDSPVLRSFLGYAPVLQAIALWFEDDENFRLRREQIEDDFRGATSAEILGDLLNKLLVREQDKLVRAVEAKVSTLPGVDFGALRKLLYTPKEQLRRLQLLRTGDSSEATGPSSQPMPGAVAEAYADALASFVPQHPFIRSRDFAGPAFRDFALAYLVNEDEVEDLGIRAEMEGPNFIPTPVYADTISRVLVQPYPATLAGALLESVSARLSAGETATAKVFPDEAAGKAGLGVHRFEVVEDSGPRPRELMSVLLRISDNCPLRFARRLRNADVFVMGAVTLGVPGGVLEILDSRVTATSLSIKADRVMFHTGHAGGEVDLAAQEFDGPSGPCHVEKLGPGDARISWPGGRVYPWSSYFRDTGREETGDLAGAMVALKHILSWMQSHRREEPGRHRKIVDVVAVGQSEVRRLLLAFLMRKGVLRLEGSYYRIALAEAQKYEINWQSVRRAERKPGTDALLREFLATRA